MFTRWLNSAADLAASASNKSAATPTAPLALEPLEERQMLSSVTVFAAGQTGEEVMNVFVGEQRIATVENVGGDVDRREFVAYEFELEETFTANDVRIEFVNDLYQPEIGVDRNLVIDAIEVDGVRTETESAEVFSTGTWRPGIGVAPGFLQSEVLHTNGSFEFSAAANPATVFFAGNTWTIEPRNNNADQVSVGEDGSVILSGANGPLSITREITGLQPNDVVTWRIDAFRDAISGSFGSLGQPFATVGLNFYDQDGENFQEERWDISNLQGDLQLQELQFAIPAETTAIFAWIWIDQFPDGVNIPLVVQDFELSVLDTSGDVTPPSLTVNPFSVTRPTEGEINFGLDLNDDLALAAASFGLSPTAIRVEGPNGYTNIAGLRSGIPGTVNSQRLIFGVEGPGGAWGSEDNGTYSIFLNDNSFVDQAGNVAAGGLIGQFQVNIVNLPADTEAPTAQLLVPRPVTSDPGALIRFTLITRDNRSPIPFANVLTVIGPNGQEFQVTGVAGGFDAENQQNFEIFEIPAPFGGWKPANNGEYLVRLDEGSLRDRAGNTAPGGILGSFRIQVGILS